jgi:hypothetical protein
MKIFFSVLIIVVSCFTGCQKQPYNTYYEYNSNTGTENVISSDTDWSGNIIVSGIQKVSGAALVINSGSTVTLDRSAVLLVENGGKLIIQKHSSILFSSESYVYIDSGTLSAQGTAADSVYFNSGSTAGCVVLYSGSKADFNFCMFSGMNNGIDAKKGASVRITDCKIYKCKSHGITLENGVLIPDSMALAHNKLTGNGGYGLEIGANNVDKISKNNNIDSNKLEGVHINGEVVNHTCTWKTLDVPYTVTGIITIFDSVKAPALTIEPGCVFLMEKYSSFDVGSDSASKSSDSVSGTLVAQGTEKDSIYFKPKNIDQGWGYLENNNSPHGGLHFKKRASAMSVLDFCVIDSALNGIYLKSGSRIKLTNSHIYGSYNSGIICEDSAGFADSTKFANNIISNNGNYGIELFPAFVSSISPSNRFEGNRGVKISSGKVLKDALWRKLDSPYYVIGEINIADTTGPVLTIEPGTVFLMDTNSYFHIGSSSESATLIALGTSSDSIKFKPANDTLEWGYSSTPFGGLYFDEKASDTSSVEYTLIDFANGGIYTSVSANIKNCTISNYSRYGIGMSKTGLDTNIQQVTYRPISGTIPEIKDFSIK